MGLLAMSDHPGKVACEGANGHVTQSSDTQYLEAPDKATTALWAPITSLILGLLVLAVFPCMCGYLDWQGLPFSTCAVAIACYGWLATKAKFLVRIFYISVVILSVLLLGNNVADVLWFVHNPVWPNDWFPGK